MKRGRMSPPVGGRGLCISTGEVARVSGQDRALRKGYYSKQSVTNKGTLMPLSLCMSCKFVNKVV